MDQNFKCSGNCLSCSPAQRAYCSSQHAYSNMKVLDQMMGIVLSMQGDIRSLSEKIEAIQNNEANIFDPNAEGLFRKPVSQTSVDTAQSGDGAESRGPETI